MKNVRCFVWLTALAATLAVASPAFAQDPDAPAEEAPAEAPAADEGGDVDVDAAIDDAIDSTPAEDAAASAPAEGTDPAAAEAASDDDEKEPAVDPMEGLEKDDKLYWSTLRGVYTMQQRRFEKNGRFGVTLYGGLIPNNIFEQYYPVGLRLNFFILENIGVELAGSYNFKAKTGLEDLIRENDGIAAGQVLIGDTQVSHTNFGLVWSPFYGKSAFYNSGLVHFDLFLFAGAGLVVAQTTPNFNADPETEIKPEGALGAGIAFYLGRHVAARVDFRQFVFAKVVGGVANPSEVSLGLSYFF